MDIVSIIMGHRQETEDIMPKNKEKELYERSKALTKDNIISVVVDIIIISFGLMISSFGTAIFYAAELGSSPMATFCDGLHNIFHISYGTANTLANIVLLVVLFFLARSYINIGTVLCVFTIGLWVNLFTPMLSNLLIVQWGMLPRVLCTVAGTVLMGVGLGLYVAVDRGFGALEGLVKLLCIKKSISYTKAKVIQDIILVVAGILLSATWGVGTLIAMLLTGPVLQFSIQHFTPVLKRRRTAAA